jgi:hypothetical protein
MLVSLVLFALFRIYDSTQDDKDVTVQVPLVEVQTGAVHCAPGDSETVTAGCPGIIALPAHCDTLPR